MPQKSPDPRAKPKRTLMFQQSTAKAVDGRNTLVPPEKKNGFKRSPNKKTTPCKKQAAGNPKSSWQKIGTWYDSIVGDEGHFYHKTVIIPQTLRLLQLEEKSTLLDIGCGQGILSRSVPKIASYTGLDCAQTLIKAALEKNLCSNHQFIQCDVTKKWPALPCNSYSHAACILALQNIQNPEKIFIELASVMQVFGTVVIVINHPCFRIPRHSRWGNDEKTDTQTRELFSYMSPLDIPIIAHPGTSNTQTWSYHRPLSYYSTIWTKAGFVIDAVEEWVSPKTSTGSAAKRENRARKEFPLFMAIRLLRIPKKSYFGAENTRL